MEGGKSHRATKKPDLELPHPLHSQIHYQDLGNKGTI